MTWWMYLQFTLYLVAAAGFLAKRAPVSVIVGIWFLMMCWESYDMHPDHVVVYSVPLFYAAYKAVHRKPLAPLMKVTWTRTKREST